MLYSKRHKKIYEKTTDKKLLIKRASFLLDTHLLNFQDQKKLLDALKEISYILSKLKELLV